jgi:hypothetical protein
MQAAQSRENMLRDGIITPAGQKIIGTWEAAGKVEGQTQGIDSKPR